jgi:hypothetical protein
MIPVNGNIRLVDILQILSLTPGKDSNFPRGSSNPAKKREMFRKIMYAASMNQWSKSVVKKYLQIKDDRDNLFTGDCYGSDDNNNRQRSFNG